MRHGTNKGNETDMSLLTFTRARSTKLQLAVLPCELKPGGFIPVTCTAGFFEKRRCQNATKREDFRSY